MSAYLEFLTYGTKLATQSAAMPLSAVKILRQSAHQTLAAIFQYQFVPEDSVLSLDIAFNFFLSSSGSPILLYFVRDELVKYSSRTFGDDLRPNYYSSLGLQGAASAIFTPIAGRECKVTCLDGRDLGKVFNNHDVEI